jgi:hypothetical protein
LFSSVQQENDARKVQKCTPNADKSQSAQQEISHLHLRHFCYCLILFLY